MITHKITAACLHCQKPVDIVEVGCPDCTAGGMSTAYRDQESQRGPAPEVSVENLLFTGEPKIERLGDLTIRELQTRLPWTVHYHRDFRSSPMTHKDFAHALLHVAKATGKLAAVVNDAEHGGSEFLPEEVDRFVADLVVCALRMANTCPGRTIDLQRAVEDRIELKNEAELRREKQ
jgi:hypothetical protein